MVSQVKRHFMEWDTPNEAIVDIQWEQIFW
jgi:hypothetical protein